VVSTDMMLTVEQYQQLVRNLALRRPGAGKASQDFIIEGGMTLENPDFTKEDIDFLAWQNAAKDKICAVYGMAPILIGDDDSAQYQSAPYAIKLYWQQTLVPLLRSYEDAWDQYFVRRLGLDTYVRFDLSQVAALQEDEGDKIANARAVWDMGVSFSAVNERFGLGFDDEVAQTADFLPRPTMTPLAEDEPEQRSFTKLTNSDIRKRASDSRFLIQRQRRLARLERAAWGELKQLASDFQAQTLEAAKSAMSRQGVNGGGALLAKSKIMDLAAGFGAGISEKVEPMQREAAQVGVASVQELVDGKMLAWHDRVKAVSFQPETEATLLARKRLLREGSGPDWIAEVGEKTADAILEAAASGVDEGAAQGTVSKAIRGLWSGWASGRAATIARTEIGTMYNHARFDEMPAQGFKKHEWVTSIDEATRTGEYDHAAADGEVRRIGLDTFSTGLHFPQETGGAPGNVINCRCQTIPVVEE